MECCYGCNGGLRCFNPSSPNYLSYCGERPNTGPEETTKKEEEDSE